MPDILTWPARTYPPVSLYTASARERLALLVALQETQWRIVFWALLVLAWPPAYKKAKSMRRRLFCLERKLAAHRRKWG